MHDDPPPATLTGSQRSYLRRLAHGRAAVVQVGQAGVTDAVLAAVAAALRAHELIKVRMDRPEDKQGLAARLASGSDSALCGLVGHTAILYRARARDPEIVVPAPRRAGPASGATPGAAPAVAAPSPVPVVAAVPAA